MQAMIREYVDEKIRSVMLSAIEKVPYVKNILHKELFPLFFVHCI